jgi:hypothetical protein
VFVFGVSVRRSSAGYSVFKASSTALGKQIAGPVE